MNLTRDHLERIIIDRIIVDTPEGRRSLKQGNEEPSHVHKALLSDSPEFKRISVEYLRLDERLPHTLLKPIANRIKMVAERYTNLRENTIPALLEEECQAYASYYLLINIEKVSRLLKADLSGNLPENSRVLDYGCGPGTGALALATLSKCPFSLLAVDSNSHMRRIATKLIQNLKSAEAVSSFEVIPPEAGIKGTFDLIIVGHVLNEMLEPDQDKLVKMLLSHLSAQGTLLILESALPKQTRELMRMRDFLLSTDKFLSVVFPCTHQLPCQMLKASETDWCHGSMHWNPPHLIRQLDQLTGFNKHELKYSGLILRRNAELPGSTLKRYRVVGPPEHNKSGHATALCGHNFFGVTSLRKRSRNESNVEFRRAEHFDLLEIDGTEALNNEFSSSFDVRRQRAP